MHDFLSWNVSLGRWAGVYVRIHVLFLLFAVIALYLGSQSERSELLSYAVVGLAILLSSVLVHELGHCVAAWRLGGNVEHVLLWPLGGLTHVNVSHEPREELMTALAGPIANVVVCLVVAPALLLMNLAVAPLLNPLQPPVGATLSWTEGLEMVFWINWLLVVVNLVPAFPMDGGRALRCLLWPRFGYRRAVVLVARTAMIMAIALPVLAWVFGIFDRYEHAWAPMVIFGIFLYFSARQEVEKLAEHNAEEGFFGYDFSQGYSSLDQEFESADSPRRGRLRRWWHGVQEARQQRRRQMEVEEERQVDAILQRLHDTGMKDLTSEERTLLARVSRRYRDRQRG